MTDTASESRRWCLDDFTQPAAATGTGTAWRCFTDQVMGGVSQARASHEQVVDRPALCVRGQVSLANNGGFVQVALDLSPDGRCIDASLWAGVALTVRGKDQKWSVNLRTADCVRPWQSYRAPFTAPREWTEIWLPFTAFEPHRLDAPLATHSLRRLGIIAIGEPGAVEIAVGKVALYDSNPSKATVPYDSSPG